MSAVVECPACHESLELPDEFMDGVICPHCEAAFVLQPVLLADLEKQAASGDEAAAAASPTASEGQAGSQASAGTPADDANDGDADTGAVTEGDAAHKDASASSSGLRFAALASSGDRGPGGSSKDSDDEGGIAVAAAGAESAAAASQKDATSKGSSGTKDKAEHKSGDSDAPWSGLSDTPSESTQASSAASGSMSAKAAHHRKKQGPGLMAQAIGVFGGGLVGLYLGYWLLNYFGGPQFYFMEIPLPFVSHSGSQETDSGDFPPPPGDGPITIESPRNNPPRRNRRPRNNDQGRAEPVAPMQPVATHPAEPPLSPQPRGAMPRYSAQELADALTEANRATSKPGGDVDVTAELYEQLCRLAQVATFVDVNEPQVLARREAVHTVLRRITAQPQQLAAVNAQAQAMLTAAAAADEPSPPQGILLAGQVIDTQSSGPWQLTRVELLNAAAGATPNHPAPNSPAPGNPVPSGAPADGAASGTPAAAFAPAAAAAVTPAVVSPAVISPATTRLVADAGTAAPSAVTLVSTGRIPLLPGMSRLFVGSLIAHPRQALQGYMGSDSPVVWAGMWVTLAADAS